MTRRVLPGKAGWQLWYDVQIPRIAKKLKAGLVMMTGGVTAKTTLPQCVWMPERADPIQGRAYPLYSGRLTETLPRAEALLCYSDHDREWLSRRDEQAAGKLVVVHPSADASAGPLSMGDREEAKAEFAQGREYFLADASAAKEEELIHLLKAFSLFKKRQHSNLQLVIRGVHDEEMQKKLETYKYREDVHWRLPAGAGNHRLMGAAYAGIFLFEGNSLGETVLDAWKSGVPVIGNGEGPLGGEAILSAGDADPGSLAAQLMSVYKDEELRRRLIGLGFARVADFSSGRTVDAVRSVISRSV